MARKALNNTKKQKKKKTKKSVYCDYTNEAVEQALCAIKQGNTIRSASKI